MTRIEDYERGNRALPQTHLTWPLYGAGLDKLGQNGKPVERPLPAITDDEMLMRIDACSLCYTDLKQIRLGSSHPRLLGRDLAADPVVPGHEVSLTVVTVGKNLTGEYHVGDRFTLQPDLWLNGKSIPFCFSLDGGYRQYTRVGHEILNADAG
ncbi:MAG: alcohol dehydrogenase catalytic domain-containing protein, partial [Anaerolineales bacterium]|nr:alcohol dehydrogenase catalytic domain-containing protein [Anaerolineales bacterium]